MTVEQYNNYCRKHGFKTLDENKIIKTGCVLKVPKAPNKTEAEYGRILESMKQRGEIVRYEYEGVTLRWLDMRYTPDWFVVVRMCHTWQENDPQRRDPPWVSYVFKAIEVKGARIWDRDIVRFKGARAMWPEIEFEMWQKKSGSWMQLF
jgi:hypothetical protein